MSTQLTRRWLREGFNGYAPRDDWMPSRYLSWTSARLCMDYGGSTTFRSVKGGYSDRYIQWARRPLGA